ncbi:unnamed protein product, partial [Cuscuta epithymum]
MLRVDNFSSKAFLLSCGQTEYTMLRWRTSDRPAMRRRRKALVVQLLVGNAAAVVEDIAWLYDCSLAMGWRYDSSAWKSFSSFFQLQKRMDPMLIGIDKLGLYFPRRNGPGMSPCSLGWQVMGELLEFLSLRREEALERFMADIIFYPLTTYVFSLIFVSISFPNVPDLHRDSSTSICFSYSAGIDIGNKGDNV